MSLSSDLTRREEGTPAERTQTGPVFTPAVDIYEDQESLVVLADLPGVAPEDLAIRLENDTLTLEARSLASAEPEGEELLGEFRPGAYYRQFTLSEAIDREGIDARLSDGVLKLVLPKAEAVKPRRIQVQAG
jgi:HSP20 family molecular chaperone IbpA